MQKNQMPSTKLLQSNIDNEFIKELVSKIDQGEQHKMVDLSKVDQLLAVNYAFGNPYSWLTYVNVVLSPVIQYELVKKDPACYFKILAIDSRVLHYVKTNHLFEYCAHGNLDGTIDADHIEKELSHLAKEDIVKLCKILSKRFPENVRIKEIVAYHALIC